MTKQETGPSRPQAKNGFNSAGTRRAGNQSYPDYGAPFMADEMQATGPKRPAAKNGFNSAGTRRNGSIKYENYGADFQCNESYAGGKGESGKNG